MALSVDKGSDALWEAAVSVRWTRVLVRVAIHYDQDNLRGGKGLVQFTLPGDFPSLREVKTGN